MVVTFCLVNSAVAGWVTSGNNMYSDVNGNVGIGTSEPWCKLELIGSFRLTDAIVFGNNLGAANWQMWNEGPGKGPFWFPSFSAQDYDAKINLWDYTEPATSGHSLFVLAGGLTNVDMIIDGHFGVLGDLVVGNPGNWRMGNTGARKGPEWFGYFSNQDYDATMQIMDFADPAPTARSYLVVGGIHTDIDLIVDGRLGLFNNLVVGPSGETLFADVSTGKVGIGTTSPSAKLTVRGRLSLQSESTGVSVLELGEGLDYAEGFDVTKTEEVGPGTVLVIDPANAGKLTVSTRAYDTKVAGIVAGAKSLGSGVRLGTGQFDQDVALAGRVYCSVDATENAVRPGDLLTTSSTPGYAMKVTDHVRSQGAVLGKAMESLEQGKKGQILVLVALQ